MAQRTIGDTLVLPLKLLAVVTVAGFLFWLYVNAEPTEVVVEEPEEPASDTFIGAMLENPMFFEDERIRLSGVFVGDRLGLNAFWASDEAPNTNEEEEAPPTLLIRIPRELVDQGEGVGEGERALVTGYLHTLSDSVLDAWEAEGVFTDPDDRERVAAEELFVEADGVSSAAVGEPNDDPEPGQD